MSRKECKKCQERVRAKERAVAVCWGGEGRGNTRKAVLAKDKTDLCSVSMGLSWKSSDR